jgi:hypothetical protein
MESAKNDPPIPSLRGDPEIHGIVLDRIEYDKKAYHLGPFKPIAGRVPSAFYDEIFVSVDVTVRRTNPLYVLTEVYVYKRNDKVTRDGPPGEWLLAETRRSRITLSEIPGIVQLYKVEPASQKAPAEEPKKPPTPPWVDMTEQQEEDDDIPF